MVQQHEADKERVLDGPTLTSETFDHSRPNVIRDLSVTDDADELDLLALVLGELVLPAVAKRLESLRTNAGPDCERPVPREQKVWPESNARTASMIS